MAAEISIPHHAGDTDDDATTFRHIMTVVGVTFGLMGVVALIA